MVLHTGFAYVAETKKLPMSHNKCASFHDDSITHNELFGLVHLDALELDYSVVRRLLYCNTASQSKMTCIIDRHLKLFNAGNRAFCI